MIRIISGKYRHRVLKLPNEEITRPTKDSAREGLFSSLGYIENKSFLDPFGGSGAVSIEAYSRGASKVVINELNKDSYKIIKDNLSNLQINDIETYNLLDLDLYKKLKNDNYKFDYIFLDPPYKMVIDTDYIESNLKELLNANGTIIIESDKDISNSFNEYNVKCLKYGRSMMFILRSKYE